MAIHHLLASALLALTYLQSEFHVQQPQLNSTEWLDYKQQFGKSYESEEVDSLRKLIFFANKYKAEQLNRKHEHTQFGINRFSDHTEKELSLLMGLRVDKYRGHRLKSKVDIVERAELLEKILNGRRSTPDEVDWRKVPNRVSTVKNQGKCSASWAFAAVGALEGQEVLANKSKLLSLSAQNLVDCVYGGNLVCEIGGLPDDAFTYVANGIESEIDYPYVGIQKACTFSKSKTIMTDKGHLDLPLGDEQILKETVANYGPVSVGLAANSAFVFYKAGVLVDPRCESDIVILNHGALIVGYGHDKESNLDYWLVKNSWGEEWGEKGYFRIVRNKNNHCGISSMASVPRI